jgi:hypothetical protein
MNNWPRIAPMIGFSLILVLGLILRSKEKHTMKKT